MIVCGPILKYEAVHPFMKPRGPDSFSTFMKCAPGPPIFPSRSFITRVLITSGGFAAVVATTEVIRLAMKCVEFFSLSKLRLWTMMLFLITSYVPSCALVNSAARITVALTPAYSPPTPLSQTIPLRSRNTLPPLGVAPFADWNRTFTKSIGLKIAEPIPPLANQLPHFTNGLFPTSLITSSWDLFFPSYEYSVVA